MSTDPLSRLIVPSLFDVDGHRRLYRGVEPVTDGHAAALVGAKRRGVSGVLLHRREQLVAGEVLVRFAAGHAVARLGEVLLAQIEGVEAQRQGELGPSPTLCRTPRIGAPGAR